MIFGDLFGILHLTRKVQQLPNKEKSKKQIQCMKRELGSRSKSIIKNNRRERSIKTPKHQGR